MESNQAATPREYDESNPIDRAIDAFNEAYPLACNDPIDWPAHFIEDVRAAIIAALATLEPSDAAGAPIYQTGWTSPENVWGDVDKATYDTYEEFGYTRRRIVYAAPVAPAAPYDPDEDAYVIDRLSKLLAAISIALKGEEEALRGHSYHDLPQLVQEAMLVIAEQRELLTAWYEANAKGTVTVEDVAYLLVTQTAALLAAPTPTVAADAAAPNGWKLVPIEPTVSMVVDGFESEYRFRESPEFAAMAGCKGAAEAAKVCYRAMLDAAPVEAGNIADAMLKRARLHLANQAAQRMAFEREMHRLFFARYGTECFKRFGENYVYMDVDSAWRAFNAAVELSTETVDKPVNRMSDAAHDVLSERERQVSEEKCTTDHDDGYGDGQLANAAAWYALVPNVRESLQHDTRGFWPWPKNSFKAPTRRRSLVKAGALILAEIERLDRSESRDAG
jgi:hypothetical protein